MRRIKTFKLIMIMSMISIDASAHDFEVDGIYYNYNNGSSGSTVSVTFKGDKWNSFSNEYTGYVVIPQSVSYLGQTYSVTSIGGNAFDSCTGLTSVTIPNSVTNIYWSAFYGCI